VSTTVLLVDDAPQLRDLARITLGLEGWDVVAEAADGLEAVRTAFDTAPDVIVLDMQMPKMDGLAALPLLRRASPPSRIVMWSSEPGVAPRALAAGASAVVDKAVPVDHLLVALSLVAPPRG
jgi:two-component system chemotaxis response regulator CheY